MHIVGNTRFFDVPRVVQLCRCPPDSKSIFVFFIFYFDVMLII